MSDPPTQTGSNLSGVAPSTDAVAKAIAQLQLEQNGLNKSFQDGTAIVDNFTSYMKGFVQSLFTSSGATGNMSTSVTKLGTTMLDTFKNGTSAIGDSTQAMSLLGNVFNTFLAVSTSTKDLFPGLNGASKGFSTLTEQINQMGSEWGILTSLLDKSQFGGIAIEGLKHLADNASKAQEAEQSLVSLMGESGGLNKIFDEQGDLLGDLNSQTLKYTQNLGNIAIANGQTLKTTIDWANGLGKIPGIMDENIRFGNGLGESVSSLSAAMKIMSGSGQNMGKVIQVMDEAYKNLGNNGMGPVNDKAAKGLTLFATMTNLSKDLGLQFSETEGFLSGVSKEFKLIGDNTEAAARIMLRFTDSLRNTGLTSSGAVDIISGMVTQLGKLTIGTKAFISAQNGGAGGLQGSIQIDKLMREGKTDQVLTMVQDSLRKQFGGKIYTQAEGAQSQEAAAGFTRQKMLLNSGAFGNLTGGDDNKATRLLEALASGDTGSFKANDVGQGALENVAKQGNSLQEQSNTILNKISVSSELNTLNTQMTALLLLQEFTGSGNSDLHKANGGGLLDLGRKKADQDGSDKNRSIGIDTNIGAKDFAKSISSNYFTAIREGGKQLESSGSAIGSAIKNQASAFINMIGDVSGKTVEKNSQDAIARKIPNISRRGPLTKNEFLGNVDNPINQNQTARANVAGNAASVQKVETTANVHITMSDEFKNLIKVTATTPSSPASQTLDQLNSPGNQPEPRVIY